MKTNFNKLKQSKYLRVNQSNAERNLWYHLRNRGLAGFKFKRQYVIGTFIVDFICLERKLIIEVDGGQHAARASYDKQRTDWLRKEGYEVMRFWNNEVLGQIDVVLECIRRRLLERN